MRATISVQDNVVIVDGRPLKVDCSALDSNIKLVQWYGDHGDVEFVNDPTQPFRRNGTLSSLGEYKPVIDAWQAQADKIDVDETLKAVPPEEAVRLMSKIESDPTLKGHTVSEAVRLLKKVEQDPDLKDVPLNKAVGTMKRIEADPDLAALHPGPVHRELKEIDADPQLKNKSGREALAGLNKKRDDKLPKPQAPPADKPVVPKGGYPISDKPDRPRGPPPGHGPA